MPPKRKWKKPPLSSSDFTNSSSSPSDSDEPIYNIALSLLARRPLSVNELRLKLSTRSSSHAAIESVIEKLISNGFLDDRQYVEILLHSRERKTEGFSRIASELRRRGLQTDLIQEVLSQIFPKEQERLALTRAFEKKALTIKLPMDEKKISRLYNHLVRKGFRDEDIRREIRSRYGRMDDSF